MLYSIIKGMNNGGNHTYGHAGEWHMRSLGCYFYFACENIQRCHYTLRCLLIASTKFSGFGGTCIWLVLILAILNFPFSILQVGCLSEIILIFARI